jgi:asparagine synthase (glutamine-hydrolysing)
MCGIFGCFARAGRLPDLEILVRATNTLRHRGPDDGGYWMDGGVFLGHRRLAIIDVRTGSQPMATIDGRFVVTFNGEIYNYIELRAELEAAGERFATNSDTEVLLCGYRRWGTDLASRLTGMFAFAIFDRQAGTLFLARDRFGEKPLFAVEHRGCFLFASELGPLAAVAADATSVDEEALAEYLCFNYVPGERTLLAPVRRIRPGSWRLLDAQNDSGGTYWRPPDTSEVPAAELRDLDGALEAVQGRLDHAVSIALRSDVPVALFLSGGIDSSVVAESAVRQGRLRDAFCLDVAVPTFSEWSNSSWVAERLGLKLHRVVLGPEALDNFLSLVDHGDDPLADASALAVWTLSRETARHFKVVISGDGGDELFGGYLTYQATSLHRDFVAPLPTPLRRLLACLARSVPVAPGKVSFGYKARRFFRAAALSPGEAHFTWNGSFMGSEAEGLLASPTAKSAARGAGAAVARRAGLSSAPRLADLQRADIGAYLPDDILTKVDRMTMAHSLESRAPLLNENLADVALAATAWHQRALFPQSKPLLRAIADRTFGPRISRAKKQGFSIPVHDWLRGAGRPLIDELLSDGSLADTPYLDRAAVGKVRARFLAGEPLGFEVWGLLVLVAWHRLRVKTPARALTTASLDLTHRTFDLR